MPTKEKLRERLVNKLKELFQLNQPDLDFGFYRVMHLKAEEIENFIENDLLDIVEQAFSDTNQSKKEEFKAKVEEEIEKARSYGAPDPENTDAVKNAQAEYHAALDSSSSEADIYDHLYRFFERYYDNGDFVSLRYYTKETKNKAAPYAIPYNGEEVKLHWANADQYYIKTSEYFTNFTFDLRKTKEVLDIEEKDKIGALLNNNDNQPLRVHFRIVDASEGEHGNIKESDKTKRYFIINKPNPVEFNSANELVINFEYRPDPEKTGNENKWREKRNTEAVDIILKELESKQTENNSILNEYLNMLTIKAPTDNNQNRILLAKYIYKYTSRNTMDYFIHKDLGGFLRRELDFYIKNEVMHLDDIENSDLKSVESYLEKIKVMRTIANRIIDFLAQLEDFQKKLWLKKKFVVETNYCITLDRIPERHYPEIVENEDQINEWIHLFAIDEIDGFSKPLTTDFLKDNDKLVLDTQFFSEDFKVRLVASIDDFDEQCDGLMIHSENFQALNLMQNRYREQIKCTYIDPPYNTAATEILYKNGYKHSSWCSLMLDRCVLSRRLLSENGIQQTAIDDLEFHRLESVLREAFGSGNYIGNIAIMHNPKGRAQTHIADCHEYALLASKNINHAETYRISLSEEEFSKKYSKGDGIEKFRELPLRRSGSGASREERPYMYFPFLYHLKAKKLTVIPKNEYEKIYNGYNFDDKYVNSLKNKYENEGYLFILPIREDGSKGRWRWGYDSSLKGCEDGTLFVKFNKSTTVYQIDKAIESYLPKSLWYGEKYDASTKGTNLLKNIIPNNSFDYPKSLFLVSDMIIIGSREKDKLLDFFAGSGTTGHAVINLNREDGGKRKYTLVEMGEYFDTVMKPRISKVIYSDKWTNGKPENRDTGITHCYKYIRLESYEDTLNNLEFDENGAREKAINSSDSLKQDYLLRYMMDVETKGSQSLLNIDNFTDPSEYKLKVKKPGSDEYVYRNVDLIETFNYLIGLRVDHIDIPREFTADFDRIDDPEVPNDYKTKLILKGNLQQVNEENKTDNNFYWWFRKVEGWVPKNPASPNDGHTEKVLIVWRNLSGDLEKDNAVLDEWFRTNRINTRDFEFDVIFVNGSNNLPNLRLKNENWKVRLIEEEFKKRMWDAEVI